MNNQLLRRLILVVAVFGALTLGYVMLKAFMGHAYMAMMARNRPPPATVTAIKATTSDWAPEITAVGTLRAVRGVDIAPELAGQVRSVEFTSGQTVPAGAVLVAMNTDADVAQLAALEAAADLAETVLRRDQVQFDAQAISQAQLDADHADLKNKRALAAAQKALIAKKILRAPFAGKVGIRTVNPGQYLNAGDKVVTLQAIDPILVDFTVPQQDIAQVTPGGAVRLEADAFPGKPFAAKVTALSPRVDPSTRNVQVEASLNNNARMLLPGMFVRVHVSSGAPGSLVTLPQTAVTYSSYGTSVYVLKDGKAGEPLTAQQVFVTTGPTRGDQVAILKGVAAGDMVVTSGQLKLRPGSPAQVDNTVSPKNDADPQPQER